ncbi:DUF202 domain-containing protein [Micromonospora sp. 15K316]|uniref:DUF202 domain-containing protein n=1 Tax=Micromonospora sp. 15K316 TaxID=2530376 RepID=UPI0010501B01|nr:DUF202 domain-containing protein [Micromonospora sp. 15K316]TDC38602.1 DUF202 domain-containing protein [Micromonospora sp. 15K316]
MTQPRGPAEPRRGPRPDPDGGGGSPRDPGLQPERTRLAWRRSALTLTVVTVLAVRQALSGDLGGLLLAGAALVGWGVTLPIYWRRGTGTGPAPLDGRSLPAVALGAVALAVLGVVLVLRGL